MEKEYCKLSLVFLQMSFAANQLISHDITALTGQVSASYWTDLIRLLETENLIPPAPVICLPRDCVLFLCPVFSASHVQHISDLHSKFTVRPHHVWKYDR